jgi:hypothetical protein
MVSDGGGWTIIYLSSTNNAAGAPIGYTTASPELLAAAQDALLAYRDDTGSVVEDFADLPLPGAWRSDTPFDAAATDASTSVSVDGGPRTSALLRFGYQSFSSRCNDAWISSAAPYGRLCIVGTRAPFFSGFASTSADTCSDSSSGYGAAACSATRRFSIAVR